MTCRLPGPLLPLFAVCLSLCLARITDSQHAMADERSMSVNDDVLQAHIQPLLRRYCIACHNAETSEADLDLTRFRTVSDIRQHTDAWVQVRGVLDSQQMPPPSAMRPTDTEYRQLQQWVRSLLAQEARAHEGDPGPVVLRRLSNAEYTATLQDLTGVPSLNPAQEFPVDGAAGEGFTNVGSALVMSPELVRKYLDAAKVVAQHAALLPTGIRFSEFTSQRDLTDDLLQRIRGFYAQYTTSSPGTAVNLQGIQFTTNQGGRLPLADYLTATIAEREQLRTKQTTIAEVAVKRELSAVYLQQLWNALTTPDSSQSLLLQPLRQRWQKANVQDVPGLVEEISGWQSVVWKFNVVGHVGREGAPSAWMEAISPVADRQEFRLPLSATNTSPDESPAIKASESSATASPNASAFGVFPPDIQVRLIAESPLQNPLSDVPPNQSHPDSTSNADSGRHTVLWQNARLELAGQPSIWLRDVHSLQVRLQQRRSELLTQLPQYLAAAHDLEGGQTLPVAAQQHGVSEPLLQTLARYLNVTGGGPVEVQGHFTTPLKAVGGYDFVNGWGHAATPSVVANASDQEVRIPGRARPHALLAHPSVTDYVAVGWQSPVSGPVLVNVTVGDAHDACGNGFSWFVQHRSASHSRIVARGTVASGGQATVPPLQLSVIAGELVSVMIGPQDANHVCDLTDVKFTVSEQQGAQRVWNAAGDLTSDLLAGNPHPDAQGHADVWHLFQGPLTELSSETQPRTIIPKGSLLADWLARPADRPALAQQLAAALARASKPPADRNTQHPSAAADTSVPHARLTPNNQVLQQLQHLPIPLSAVSMENPEPDPRFGTQSAGADIAATDLLLTAPAEAMFRIPAELRDYQLLATATVDPDPTHAAHSIAQAHIIVRPLATADAGGFHPDSVSPVAKSPAHVRPLICAVDSAAERRVEAELAEFRRLFPAALCYTRIVPVDEVVTATLFHREDEPFRRLMLTPDQGAELDALWEELLFVSEEPLKMVVSLEQIREFSTQDRPEAVGPWDRMKPAVQARAEAFRQQQRDAESRHVAAALQLADRAWRRPLSRHELQALQSLYRRLRDEDMDHIQAVRLLIARVLTSPAFLYRLETPARGDQAMEVSDSELASRLSYFLWSSLPDAELRQLADSGQLTRPADRTNPPADPLWQQTQRMLQNPKIRRLAIHFACQWLHVRDFDQNDDKNEQLYPEFARLRGPMYEETVRFFEDMFRSNGSMLDLLDADHTFVNAELAEHYGIKHVTGTGWQRIDKLSDHGRGGILGMATMLASQSGASRTSPILRGNWVSETLLGERLPRPPPGVPQLPDTLPEGLTARQLIERHSSDAACARCHQRIDPYGFALEQFDALGRRRPQPVDTRTTVFEGPAIEGLNGLRLYLINQRRSDVMRQFCRKLLGYALGREVLLSDEPLLDQMLQQLEQQDWRFHVAVEAIVRSRQFRRIRPAANPQ